MAETISVNLANIKDIHYINKNTGEDGLVKEKVFPTAQGDVEWRKACVLTLPALPEGVDELTVERTESEMTGVGKKTWFAGQAKKEVEVRHGDVLQIRVAGNQGYTEPHLPLSSIKVESDKVDVSVEGGRVKQLLLTYPAMPKGVASYGIFRWDSPIGGGSKDSYIVQDPLVEGEETIWYKDEIEIQAIAETGYILSMSLTDKIGETFVVVESNVNARISSSVKKFKLSYPAMPEGVSTYIIRREKSPLQDAPAGVGSEAQIVVNPTSAGEVTIYYGDVLNIVAVGKEGYEQPTCVLSQTTVTGDVIAVVNAGVKIPTCQYCGEPYDQGNHFCEVLEDWI